MPRVFLVLWPSMHSSNRYFRVRISTLVDFRPYFLLSSYVTDTEYFCCVQLKDLVVSWRKILLNVFVKI